MIHRRAHRPKGRATKGRPVRHRMILFDREDDQADGFKDEPLTVIEYDFTRETAQPSVPCLPGKRHTFDLAMSRVGAWATVGSRSPCRGTRVWRCVHCLTEAKVTHRKFTPRPPIGAEEKKEKQDRRRRRTA